MSTDDPLGLNILEQCIPTASTVTTAITYCSELLITPLDAPPTGAEFQEYLGLLAGTVAQPMLLAHLLQLFDDIIIQPM